VSQVRLSDGDALDLWQETNLTPQLIDPTDPLDTRWKVPAELGQGFRREIDWREGLNLSIDDYLLAPRSETAI
jgi:hypothetical protein